MSKCILAAFSHDNSAAISLNTLPLYLSLSLSLSLFWKKLFDKKEEGGKKKMSDFKVRLVHPHSNSPSPSNNCRPITIRGSG